MREAQTCLEIAVLLGARSTRRPGNYTRFRCRSYKKVHSAQKAYGITNTIHRLTPEIFDIMLTIRSRPGKKSQRKGQHNRFMNFAHFVNSGVFSLGKQARFTLNFCSGMPLRKVHELTFLWFGLPGATPDTRLHHKIVSNSFWVTEEQKPPEIAAICPFKDLFLHM